jgi:hypothetical protein
MIIFRVRMIAHPSMRLNVRMNGSVIRQPGREYIIDYIFDYQRNYIPLNFFENQLMILSNQLCQIAISRINLLKTNKANKTAIFQELIIY